MHIVCICIHVCIYLYIYIYIHKYIHTYMCVSTLPHRLHLKMPSRTPWHTSGSHAYLEMTVLRGTKAFAELSFSVG